MESSRIHADLSDTNLNLLYSDLEEIIRVSHQDINKILKQLLRFLRRKEKNKESYILFKKNKQFILQKYFDENNAFSYRKKIKKTSENTALFKKAAANLLTKDNYPQFEMIQNYLKNSSLSDFLYCPILPENLCCRFYASIESIEFTKSIKQQLTCKFGDLFGKYAHSLWHKSNEKILLYNKSIDNKSSDRVVLIKELSEEWDHEVPWDSESSGLGKWEEIILSAETLPALSRQSLGNNSGQPLLSDNPLYKVQPCSHQTDRHNKPLRLLHKGDIVVIKGENGKKLKCQLMSIDDQNGYYLFMNAQGHKVDRISYSVLKEKLQNGNIYPVKSCRGVHYFYQNMMLFITNFLVGVSGR